MSPSERVYVLNIILACTHNVTGINIIDFHVFSSTSNPPHFSQLKNLKIVQIYHVVLSFVVTRKVIIKYYFVDTFKKIEIKAKSC